MTAWLVTHPSGIRYRVAEGTLERTLASMRSRGEDEFIVEPAPELDPLPGVSLADELLTRLP